MSVEGGRGGDDEDELRYGGHTGRTRNFAQAARGDVISHNTTLSDSRSRTGHASSRRAASGGPATYDIYIGTCIMCRSRSLVFLSLYLVLISQGLGPDG